MKLLFALMLGLAPCAASAVPTLSAAWAVGSELEGTDLTALIQPAAAKGKRPKKKSSRECRPAGSACYGGAGGRECCSGSCSSRFFLFWGHCY